MVVTTDQPDRPDKFANEASTCRFWRTLPSGVQGCSFHKGPAYLGPHPLTRFTVILFASAMLHGTFIALSQWTLDKASLQTRPYPVLFWCAKPQDQGSQAFCSILFAVSQLFLPGCSAIGGALVRWARAGHLF